jgi:outer membrane lipoprotein SlyB
LSWRLRILVVVLIGLSRCGPSYSPDTYSAGAVQQANKVEQGVVVGVRDVGISAAGTVGTVTGAAPVGSLGPRLRGGPSPRSPRWAGHWWVASLDPR